MRNLLIRIVTNALALSAAAYLVAGIDLTGGVLGVLFVALVFGVVNAILKPILMVLSFPFLLVTLGLFAFVVNAVLLLLTAALTANLAVAGFWAAVWGSVVISLVTLFLGAILPDKDDRRNDR